MFSLLAALVTTLPALASAQQLHRSFYGLAYAPDGSQVPSCGATQEAVNADVRLLAQLTPRIRMYGADCDQVGLVLDAINSTQVALTVWLGIYLSPTDSSDSIFTGQLDKIVTAIGKYGTQHVSGITVGNEYLLAGGSRALLNDAIARTNATILAMNLDKVIPIGTSEAGAPITKSLCDQVDYMMGNVHPWFGQVPVGIAGTWTHDYYTTFVEGVCDYSEASGKQTYLGEFGWPTASDSVSAQTNGPSNASVADLQIYLDSYLCAANTNQTQYFYFSFRDEPWKAVYSGVEAHWGLFDKNGTLKEGLVLPDCPVSVPSDLLASSSSSSTSLKASSSSGASTPKASSSSSSSISSSNHASSSSSRLLSLPSSFPLLSTAAALVLAAGILQL